MPVKIAINGFGRIGRCALKIAFDNPNVEIVAINDLSGPAVLAHLLKYDTSYGVYDKSVSVEIDGVSHSLESWDKAGEYYSLVSGKETYIIVDGKKILLLSQKDPSLLPWKDLAIDVVLECTGRFTKDSSSKAHVDAGAKKVIISAPVSGEGNVQTFLMGVNNDVYLGQNLVSNASCTTNCISPVVSVIHSKFKILKSLMTTVHALTAEQNVVDSVPPALKPDLRRARAGAFNIIPTTTGAAKATSDVIPDLKDKFDGISLRVPVLTGSLSDITMLVEKKTTAAEINNALIEASKSEFYKNVLAVSHVPLVSSDIIQSKYSAIVDLQMTRVVDGDLIKILAWYDNEWGYSTRLVEMAEFIGK